MDGQTLKFLLHDQIREIRAIDPTMTVLEYLRNVERLTGTKEGCAEGDCGACTVVLGELNGDALEYKAINSCIQFVPALHGKQLIAVEHLRQPDGKLHPVQQAMVDQHGSQCGFCTPGFVMSLFAMYRNGSDSSRAELDIGLSGNLCRCTGYAPIVRAANEVLPKKETDSFHQCEAETIAKLKKLDSTKSLSIQHNGYHCIVQTKISELKKFLASHPDSIIVAGATDVGLWVTKEHQELRKVVYVGGIRSLKNISFKNNYLNIGAAVTISEALPQLSKHFPDIYEMLIRFGSVQIRNSATVCGNIANGSPIGDLPPALIALGAKVVLESHKGKRTLDLENFFIDYGKQDRQADEFVKEIKIPVHSSDCEFRVYKISKRYHQDISAVCGAFFIEITEARISRARICYGGMAATPKRALNSEKALHNAIVEPAACGMAMEALQKDFSPITDFRGTSDYRMLTAMNLLRKFFLDISADQRISLREANHA